MARKIKIEEMTPPELHRALAERPIIYVPCGLIEWHGRHLPLGLDGLKMYGIVLDCARRTGGVVLPLNWIGAPGFGSFCGTLMYRPALVKRLLKDIMGQCAKLGAKVIVVTTGHYGSVQVNTVKKAAAEFARANRRVRVLARPEYEGVRIKGRVPADHAGKWETSMALALFPHLVQLGKHRPGREPIPRYRNSFYVWDQEKRPWVWPEDLRQTSSAKLGRQAVSAIRKSIVAEVEALCRQAGIPRSRR